MRAAERVGVRARELGEFEHLRGVVGRSALQGLLDRRCASGARRERSNAPRTGGRCSSSATTRPTPDRPSARRRAGRSLAAARRATEQARTARATRWRSTLADGTTAHTRCTAGSATARSARRSSPIAASASAGRSATRLSSASIQRANGTSRSSSAARPVRTRCPRCVARRASSASSRDLPIPGSPSTPSERDVPAPLASSAFSTISSSAARPTSFGVRPSSRATVAPGGAVVVRHAACMHPARSWRGRTAPRRARARSAPAAQQRATVRGPDAPRRISHRASRAEGAGGGGAGRDGPVVTRRARISHLPRQPRERRAGRGAPSADIAPGAPRWAPPGVGVSNCSRGPRRIRHTPAPRDAAPGRAQGTHTQAHTLSDAVQPRDRHSDRGSDSDSPASCVKQRLRESGSATVSQ